MIAGLGAYVLYFSWSAPLLDAKQIEAFAFGPQKVTVRDLAIHTGEEEGRLLEGLLTQVNRAKLVRGEVRFDDNGLLLVFFRTDGLQYHLRQGSDGLVGISEGAARTWVRFLLRLCMRRWRSWVFGRTGRQNDPEHGGGSDVVLSLIHISEPTR